MADEPIYETILKAKSGKLTKADAKAMVKAKRAKMRADEGAPSAPSGQTKNELVLSMLRRPGGATSPQMEEATGWKAASVRGLLGTLRKAGVAVQSTKEQGKPTVYSIAPEEDVI